MPHDPVVFISSTSDDLKEHREQAAKAALASGFSPRMMEYFLASGHAPALEVCREKVAEAEVVVVLVAHRYGWVPDGPENPDKKSITWLFGSFFRSMRLACLPPFDLREEIERVLGGSSAHYTCCLDDDWRFEEIEADARRRVGHQYEGQEHGSIVEIVIKALYDVEAAFQQLHPNASSAAVADFWRSWQVQPSALAKTDPPLLARS